MGVYGSYVAQELAQKLPKCTKLSVLEKMCYKIFLTGASVVMLQWQKIGQMGVFLMEKTWDPVLAFQH